jgi:hypothetical protein
MSTLHKFTCLTAIDKLSKLRYNLEFSKYNTAIDLKEFTIRPDLFFSRGALISKIDATIIALRTNTIPSVTDNYVLPTNVALQLFPEDFL